MAFLIMVDFGDYIDVKKNLLCSSILIEANLFTWVLLFICIIR